MKYVPVLSSLHSTKNVPDVSGNSQIISRECNRSFQSRSQNLFSSLPLLREEWKGKGRRNEVVALLVETPWMFTLFSLKQRKFTVEKPCRNTVQKSSRLKKPLSVVAMTTIFGFRKSLTICSLTVQVFIIDLIPSAR